MAQLKNFILSNFYRAKQVKIALVVDKRAKLNFENVITRGEKGSHTSVLPFC
jgi:hypothetical protein